MINYINVHHFYKCGSPLSSHFPDCIVLLRLLLRTSSVEKKRMCDEVLS